MRTDGLTTTEREELARLRRENRRLTEDGEILKTRHGFLREGDPVNMYPFAEVEKSKRRNVKRAYVCRSPVQRSTPTGLPDLHLDRGLVRHSTLDYLSHVRGQD
jgi:hypothetical protein